MSTQQRRESSLRSVVPDHYMLGTSHRGGVLGTLRCLPSPAADVLIFRYASELSRGLLKYANGLNPEHLPGVVPRPPCLPESSPSYSTMEDPSTE